MSEGACLNPVKIDDRAFAKLHNAFIPYLTDAVQALAHALDSLLKCKNANVTPEAMPQKLRKVSFQGITGQVQFTKSGDPTYSSYDIVNFQKQAENYENVKVGTWTGANKENEPPISTCSHHCPPGTKQTITVSCCWECIKVIPLFCTAHPLLRITLPHPRWRRFFPLARKEQTRTAFAELKLLFVIIMPQIG